MVTDFETRLENAKVLPRANCELHVDKSAEKFSADDHCGKRVPVGF